MGVLRVLALMCLSANGRGQVRGRGGGAAGVSPTTSRREAADKIAPFKQTVGRL